MARVNVVRRFCCLLLGVVALSSGGCLWLAAGAAGGAAVGYAYYKGKVCETYQANLGDAWAATKTALAELGMPLVAESQDGLGGFLESRTGTGERVQIHLELQPSKIPAEGGQTRICIRVANFGDKPVSERILYQIGMHLTPAAVAEVRPVPPQPLPQGPIQPSSYTPPQPLPSGIPQETAPPPLAPDTPK
jgi:hypothetical protein